MAAATMYVTPGGADTKTGADWAHAMGYAEFEADLEANAEAGDIYYVAAGAAHGNDGVYTLTSALDSNTKDGTGVAPISIIGVKYGTTAEPPTVSDWPTVKTWTDTDDRPVFVCGASYSITTGDYYKIYNIAFTGASTSVLITGAYCSVFNCYAYNSSGTANRNAFNLGATGCKLISSECISTNGRGLYCASYNMFAFANYLHDSAVGIKLTYGHCALAFNICDTCSSIGIDITDIGAVTILNNSLYSCTTGISATTAFGISAINNIIDTATDGFKWTTTTNNNFFAYNHRGNSVTEMFDTATAAYTGIHGDQWGTGGAGTDPHFTAEADGDFSLESDSPCINTGMAMVLGVG